MWEPIDLNEVLKGFRPDKVTTCKACGRTDRDVDGGIRVYSQLLKGFICLDCKKKLLEYFGPEIEEAKKEAEEERKKTIKELEEAGIVKKQNL